MFEPPSDLDYSPSGAESVYQLNEDICGSEQGVRDNYDWSSLPDVIVIEIFKYLTDSERAVLALTCKKLSELFKSACLWRSRYFDLGGSRIKHENKVLGFANAQASSLQNLVIRCRHPSYSTCKKFQKTVTALLAALYGKSRLKRFDMSSLELDRYWRFEFTREKMLTSLARFLRNQRNLQHINLSASMIGLNNGNRLLESLAFGNGKCLHHLNIEDYFQSRQAAFRADRFVEIIGKFTNLHTLYINYNSLSDDIFRTLAKNNANKLQFMSIKCYKNDPHFHRIDGYSWKALLKACPKLVVDVDFDQIGSYEIINRVLVAQIPLRYLHVWTGYFGEDEDWRIVDAIKCIGDRFQSTLKRLSLEIDGDPEDLDDAIKELLSKCKNMTTLDINAVMNVDTVEDICQLQLSGKINLHRFHVTLCGLNDLQFSALAFLEDIYAPMIREQELDFQFTSDLIIGFEY